MRKLVTLASLLALSSAVVAEGPRKGFYQNNNQGFQGEITVISTVKEVFGAYDDAYVALEGNIIKQIGDNDYIFKDATGEIKIEIENKAWRGQSITPNDKVRILGEVEQRQPQNEVDIKQITKL